MKRYAIIRVEHMCPALTEDGINICNTDKNCRNKCPYRYGDTKEQLVRKVAQALIIDQIERYRKAPNCEINKTIIEHEYRICLEKARKIVEFLGVE